MPVNTALFTEETAEQGIMPKSSTKQKDQKEFIEWAPYLKLNKDADCVSLSFVGYILEDGSDSDEEQAFALRKTSEVVKSSGKFEFETKNTSWKLRRDGFDRDLNLNDSSLQSFANKFRKGIPSDWYDVCQNYHSALQRLSSKTSRSRRSSKRISSPSAKSSPEKSIQKPQKKSTATTTSPSKNLSSKSRKVIRKQSPQKPLRRSPRNLRKRPSYVEEYSDKMEIVSDNNAAEEEGKSSCDSDERLPDGYNVDDTEEDQEAQKLSKPSSPFKTPVGRRRNQPVTADYGESPEETDDESSASSSDEASPQGTVPKQKNIWDIYKKKALEARGLSQEEESTPAANTSNRSASPESDNEQELNHQMNVEDLFNNHGEAVAEDNIIVDESKVCVIYDDAQRRRVPLRTIFEGSFEGLVNGIVEDYQFPAELVPSINFDTMPLPDRGTFVISDFRTNLELRAHTRRYTQWLNQELKNMFGDLADPYLQWEDPPPPLPQNAVISNNDNNNHNEERFNQNNLPHPKNHQNTPKQPPPRQSIESPSTKRSAISFSSTPSSSRVGKSKARRRRRK